MKKSRVISILITLAMIFGLMPMNLNTVCADVTEEGNKIIITGEVTMENRLVIEGEKTLVLEEGCLLNAKKGIEVRAGNKLIIEGTGSLKATGTEGDSGIGVSYDDNSNATLGDIVINGGNIEAIAGVFLYNESNYGGAGIGGYGVPSRKCIGGSITINGGKVYAEGGADEKDYSNAKGGAGIGGGNGQYCSQITITGGEIKTKNGSCASAIGAGNDVTMNISNPESIDISGGTIITDGNIGGSTWHTYMGEMLNISISGGNIKARQIGGGSKGGFASLTFGWTEQTKKSTRIETKFDYLYNVAFDKPYMEENDPAHKVLTPEDLTKDDKAITMVPYTPVVKKENTIKVTAKKKKIKAKKLKKKTVNVKALKVNDVMGTVSYKILKKGNIKKIYKKLKISKKGVIKFKKGKYKKKTYKIKVKITAAGNANYNSKTLTKTIKVKIK